jgi:hypothetical protein
LPSEGCNLEIRETKNRKIHSGATEPRRKRIPPRR